MGFDILTALIGVNTAIMLAGVKWAFSVHGRLSHIEAMLKATRSTMVHDVNKNSKAIDSLWAETSEIKERLGKMEGR